MLRLKPAPEFDSYAVVLSIPTESARSRFHRVVFFLVYDPVVVVVVVVTVTIVPSSFKLSTGHDRAEGGRVGPSQ